MSLKLKIRGLSPAQAIVVFYLLAVTVSTILLSLPIARHPKAHWSFLDAIFVAASAVSVTGLSTVDISETFNTLGIFILMFVLQFGGIGIMTLGTFIWLILRKKIGLKERQLIMTDQNQTSLSGLVRLLREILSLILLIELAGAAILGLYFLKYYPTWEEALLHGLFASVSATTNAGFDITGSSLFMYKHDYFVQIINMLLLILGAIGFPVLIETKDYFFNRKKPKRNHFSLYTKLTTFTFFALIIIGTLGIIILEWDHFFKGKSWHESLFYALFQSVTTRNGGLATLDVNEFSRPTILLLCVLMFIGASPSSVGGGIRTTTFAINVLTLYHFSRGRKTIKVFRREVMEDDIIKSYVVSFTAFLICSFSVIIMSYTEKHQSILSIMFEVCSAFGTTGLSLGITPELSVVGKWIIIILMFIGRVGILSFLFMFGKEEAVKYRYPKERVIIG
ncbi:TrkH family potassium uptake protein [Falsibacillus pallidus]|uniref:Potassium uptake TrkH family protein n=1 Tax=Falsibacillus pallidus TaxID=493781 RepID=A0A370GYH9_9BACI|nr:TrkH family potassium uptake protein [Falsibacillus pallidus]RDI47694.1 potassium uptake TrkH family protein [Falsibacillus pallidus]